MKKNFIIFAALMVTAFFGAEIAKAADVSIGGQIFTRMEINEHGSVTGGANDFNDNTNTSDMVLQRTVVDVKAKINDSTSAFIQLQSNRQWAAGTGGTGALSGSSNASFQVNDQDASVGIHEAYFTLKNFATLPVDLKLGRQEVIVDGHRLFGDTLWTMGQQTHDALRLDHAHDNMSLTYAYILGAESGLAVNSNAINDDDTEAHLLRFGYKGLLGGDLSVIYSYLNDPCGVTTGCSLTASKDNDFHTIGFRQAGQLYGIDYRGEYYYQWGNADYAAQNIAGRTNDVASSRSVDRDAYMFGVRVGKTFNNVNMKPGLTVWYDYLSGTSDSDIDTTGDATWGSFNTLFDTGHKFYGLQDLFLGVGTGNATNGTAGLGLQDLAIKAKLSPMPGWTVKADYHWFWTAEGVVGNPGASLNGDGTVSNALGNELDITIINKYNANTNIMIGFSNYTTTAAFRDLRSVVGDGANWAYLQFDVKF